MKNQFGLLTKDSAVECYFYIFKFPSVAVFITSCSLGCSIS